MKVEKSQCEIDGGFEGSSKFAIIEAKCEKVKDFMIRQLYYPYRLWTSKIGKEKEVIPIFLSVSNGIFRFFTFRFSELDLYNSIELVHERRYCINKISIGIEDIRNILDTVETIPDHPKIPFPQADSFPRVLDLIDSIHNAEEPLSKEDITLKYAFDLRQAKYYLDAIEYLGLLDEVKGAEVAYCLSTKGQNIMSENLRERNLLLIKCILSHQSFKVALELCLKYSRRLTTDDLIVIMRDNIPQSYAETTLKRRAQTVKTWIYWILQLIDESAAFG